ncbi:MAG: acetyl/propionyl/methylcrotonyl-CoA carboxylase subunit alpha [Hyphomicrobiales bacterium]
MFSKILIANRGEIACRIIRTARRMGIKTVAVYSEIDKNALHVHMADEAFHIGPSPVSESYLNSERIIESALISGAQAIHPGYGFLSENADFVEAVEADGLVFIGPSASAIRKMGLKDAAKSLMEDAKVPVVPGYHGDNQDPTFLARQADIIGYPILIKARAGGGGKGMRKVDQPSDFQMCLEGAQREGLASFGDAHILIEKYISAPRHIEVQIFGDNHGNALHLFERDCSIQRRHQKVIEEAPAPGMTDDVRRAMTNAAVKAAKAIDYSGAGTIEFIVDGSGPLREDGFWFMEMNTRLQVEHPVTEAIIGHDLVEWQLRVASGESVPVQQNELKIDGHAFEARLYAEDPSRNFIPATGHLHHLKFGDARIDTGVQSGSDISSYYDPMIAKVITHGANRTSALSKLNRALQETHVAGLVSNLAFLTALTEHDGFKHGAVDTNLIERDFNALTELPDLPEYVLLIAAVCALNLKLNDPLLGWRLWGSADHSIRLVYQKEILEPRITILGQNHVRLSGTEVELQDLRQLNTHLSGFSNGQRVSADVIQYEEQYKRSISVQHQGRIWAFDSVDTLQSVAQASNGGNAIVAPMTGTVKLVAIKPGQQVNCGDTLLVLEAMKMELSLSAPRDCIVSSIHCGGGSQVSEGDILIEVEDDTRPMGKAK